MLDCLPVESFHNTTANFSVNTSVTFLVNGGERPLLMVYFLECLETSPFRWRWFCRCKINRHGYAFRRTRNVFTNGAQFRSIWLAALWKSWRNFFCFLSFMHEHSTSKSKSALFLSFMHAQRIQKVTSLSSSTSALATLGKTWKGSVSCCFSCMAETGTFEKLSIFPEHLIDFENFLEQTQ